MVLDVEEAAVAFADVACALASANVPAIPGGISCSLGLGRLVALRKPSGGTRGLVVGEFPPDRRWHPCAKVCHAAPFQYALGNRAGCEALAHELQARCERDPPLTLMSFRTSVIRAPVHFPLQNLAL